MTENFDFLKNPFEGLETSNVTGIQNKFEKIAKNLFENYGIKCGDKIFRFAEIELYYYKKEEGSKKNWDDTWNRETYPRNKNAGEIFFHYSGADICFQCHFDERERKNEYGEFGGILIRSLLDGDKIIAGPLFCANTILNTCKNEMPILKSNTSQSYKFEKTIRCGIKSDENQEKGKELFLCYYATSVNDKILLWDKTSERIVWDKKNGEFNNKTRNYKRERKFY